MPFPIESTVEWQGPFEGPFGPSPGKVRTKGIVNGYKLMVRENVTGEEYMVEPEELTVLNVTGIVNRGQQNAIWAAKLSKKGGRKTRKNRRTRRMN